MALLTAGTKLTTSLQAIQWKRSGMTQADIAAFQALIRNPIAGGYGAAAATGQGWVENGCLFLPNNRTQEGIRLSPDDWLMVDGAGWPIVVPNSIFGTSWQHS